MAGCSFEVLLQLALDDADLDGAAEIIVFNSVTLDGVVQAPGRPDEFIRAEGPTANRFRVRS